VSRTIFVEHVFLVVLVHLCTLASLAVGALLQVKLDANGLLSVTSAQLLYEVPLTADELKDVPMTDAVCHRKPCPFQVA